MHRFFITAESIEGEVVRITGGDFNHISHSLRLKTGDMITISIGDGWDYIVELEDFTDKMATGRIAEKRRNLNEPGLKVTLGQAIPKKNNMDLIIQKTTEIGVYRIIPLVTRRTIVKLEGKRRVKRLERWQRIAEEAAKQSQRGFIPRIEEIRHLKDLEEIKDNYDLILIPWEDEEDNYFKDIWNNINDDQVKSVLLLIGPEGGFPAEEIDFLKKLGGIPLTLGPRILRTETAGLVALTMLLYESGDLGGK